MANDKGIFRGATNALKISAFVREKKIVTTRIRSFAAIIVPTLGC
jgi:hypothetical protein